MGSFIRFCVVMLMCAALAACGGGGDEAAVEDTAGPSDAPPTVESIEQEEPEPEPIALPEGFPEAVPMLAVLEISSVETMDSDKRMFKVVGDSTSTIHQVLEHYEKVFAENGWTEDMSMALKEATFISASKDGLVVSIESIQGPLGGSVVTITTGNL